MSHFVRSLQRGLEVIRAFDAEAPELTLSDVATSSTSPACRSRRS
jgi:IclR family transcriptional regulator, pca regulon regulatory protein